MRSCSHGPLLASFVSSHLHHPCERNSFHGRQGEWIAKRKLIVLNKAHAGQQLLLSACWMAVMALTAYSDADDADHAASAVCNAKVPPSRLLDSRLHTPSQTPNLYNLNPSRIYNETRGKTNQLIMVVLWPDRIYESPLCHT